MGQWYRGLDSVDKLLVTWAWGHTCWIPRAHAKSDVLPHICSLCTLAERWVAEVGESRKAQQLQLGDEGACSTQPLRAKEPAAGKPKGKTDTWGCSLKFLGTLFYTHPQLTLYSHINSQLAEPKEKLLRKINVLSWHLPLFPGSSWLCVNQVRRISRE